MAIKIKTIITEIAVELWTFIFGGSGNMTYLDLDQQKIMTKHVNIVGSPLLQAAFILGIIGVVCVTIYCIARALKLLNKKVLIGLVIGSICLFICVGVMFTFANNELLVGTAKVYQQTDSDVTFEQAIEFVKTNYIMNVGNSPVVISIFSFINAGLLGSSLLVEKFVKEK